MRALEGLNGVDYLQHGAVAEASTWVFGKVIRHLKAHGYSDRNLKAVRKYARAQWMTDFLQLDHWRFHLQAPYDWRLPPQFLETRDQYFSRLGKMIEGMVQTNHNKVVLLAHSMGCKTCHYFLYWVHERRGRRWIDQHIHGLFAISGPFLGSPKAFRSTLMGEVIERFHSDATKSFWYFYDFFSFCSSGILVALNRTWGLGPSSLQPIR